MENTRNWTVIYDNGWEEVRIKADADNVLNWAYCDQAGSLEELSWRPTNTVKDLRQWLETHHVDHNAYTCSRNTPVWEKIFAGCSSTTTVRSLVKSVQQSGQLAI